MLCFVFWCCMCDQLLRLTIFLFQYKLCRKITNGCPLVLIILFKSVHLTKELAVYFTMDVVSSVGMLSTLSLAVVNLSWCLLSTRSV